MYQLINEFSPLSSMSFPPRKPVLQSTNKINKTPETEPTTMPTVVPVDKPPVSTWKSTRRKYRNLGNVAWI